MKKIFFCIAAYALLGLSEANAIYVPLTVTAGFNADVIANGVGTATATTSTTMDGANYVFVSNGWQQTAASTPCTTGFPTTGIIPSAVTTGLNYQLAGYTGNNVLRINTNTAATLTFQTAYNAQTLYLLAVTGSGTTTITVQTNFTDGTNQVSPGIVVADWYGGANAAYTGFQRLHRTNNTLDNNTNGPRLYQYSIAINAANQAKLISSIQITRTASTSTSPTLNVLAVSIDQIPPVSCSAPTALQANSITTTAASLDWTQTGVPVNYEIKYGVAGFPVATGGTSIFTATKPYTLNPPLTPATSYDYYVRAICAPGDTSAWSAVKNFTTACNAPSVVSKKDSFNCGTGAVNLEATTTTGAAIKWYAASTGGTALATGNFFTTPIVAATTTYYISAVAGTCESTPRQAVVATIRPVPVVNLGRDTTICPGVSYTFNAGNPGAAYVWAPDGETTQMITKNAAGQYSVAVTVNKCVNRDTIIITPGITPVNNLSDSVNLCEGDVTALNAGNTGSTFIWTPGGATTQTINVNAGGTYSVDIKSIHGCKITSSSFVNMRPLPVDNLGNDTAICPAASIALDAGNPGYSYQWNTGVTTQTISSGDSGIYAVTVTSPYNCINNDTIHIAFLPAPRTEGFNFIPKFYEALGKVSFEALNPTNVSGYEWDFGDNSALDINANPTHVYATSGEFEVTLKVYNDCSDYSVKQKINVDLPTGVVTVTEDNLRLNLYPNPVKTVLNIGSANTDYELQDVMIFNAAGAMVYHHKADSKTMHQLSVGHFSTGIYLVRILTDKGFVNRQIQVLK